MTVGWYESDCCVGKWVSTPPPLMKSRSEKQKVTLEERQEFQLKLILIQSSRQKGRAYSNVAIIATEVPSKEARGRTNVSVSNNSDVGHTAPKAALGTSVRSSEEKSSAMDCMQRSRYVYLNQVPTLYSFRSIHTP